MTRDHSALGAGAELLVVTPTKELFWIDAEDGGELAREEALDAPVSVVLLPKSTHLRRVRQDQKGSA